MLVHSESNQLRSGVRERVEECDGSGTGAERDDLVGRRGVCRGKRLLLWEGRGKREKGRGRGGSDVGELTDSTEHAPTQKSACFPLPAHFPASAGSGLTAP